MADREAKASARDVIEMLRRHYLPEGRQPAGIFAPEIQAPEGQRRADLIWQGVTAAGGSELIGHEVKVSRADVLVELEDLTKSDPWQRYCDRWWLVIPDPALIEGLTLPPSWGVLAPPSGRRTRSMTVLVPAPQLKPVDKAAAYATVARWLHWRHYNLAVEHARTTNEVERLRASERDLMNRVPFEAPSKRKLDQVVEEIVRGLGGPGGPGQVGDWRSSVDVADVVAALRGLGSVYSRAQTVQNQVTAALRAWRRLTEGVNPDAVQELEKAVAALDEPQQAVA